MYRQEDDEFNFLIEMVFNPFHTFATLEEIGEVLLITHNFLRLLTKLCFLLAVELSK